MNSWSAIENTIDKILAVPFTLFFFKCRFLWLVDLFNMYSYKKVHLDMTSIQVCCDRMVVGFKTTYAISAYHYLSCEFESRSWQCVLYATLCDQVCQWLATDGWFSLGPPVSSTIKTDHQDITEILLKVVLNIIALYPKQVLSDVRGECRV